MSNRQLLFFAACFLALNNSFTVARAEQRYYGCGGNTIETGQCLYKKYNEEDLELNQEYKKLMSVLKGFGEYWVKDLRDAQRKWIEYRDLNCKFYGDYFKGGSGLGSEVIACKIRMTMERRTELETFRKGI